MVEATRRLLAIHPNVKIIGLSAFTDQFYVKEMMNSGAAGYVTKGEAVEEIVRAIKTVHDSSKKYLCPDIAAYVVNAMFGSASRENAPAQLSYRERQVLHLVAEGCSSSDIAERLHLAASTVEVHRRNIMRKLNLHTIADLTKYAIRNGISAV